MKRISDENGVDAGYRNFGRLALAFIPYALGLGAAIWLGVWIGTHDFRHQLSAEERAAIYTGAEKRPKSKIAIVIVPSSCVTITRADIDGKLLSIYGRNDCHSSLRYVAWHWSLLSPNGTVIQSGYTNQCPEPREPNDQAECFFGKEWWDDGIPSDDRAATLRVWTEQ